MKLDTSKIDSSKIDRSRLDTSKIVGRGDEGAAAAPPRAKKAVEAVPEMEKTAAEIPAAEVPATKAAKRSRKSQ